MRKFLKYIALLVIGIIVLMVSIDILYTFIYTKSSPRNKIQLIMNVPPRHYDVIIIGSSRAENHIVTEMFEKKGIRTFNFAMAGAALCETSLQLKLFFERGNTADQILLQADTNFQKEGPAEGVKAKYMPYLPSNPTIYKHFQHYDREQADALKYMPMYRYWLYDAVIGFREMCMLVVRKPSKYLQNGGFMELTERMGKEEPSLLYEEFLGKNYDYDEIVATCKARNVPLFSFCTPVCKNVLKPDYFKRLEKAIPNLHDFSKVVQEDSLFATCGHMNVQGARIFTAYVLDSLKIGKQTRQKQ